GKTIPDDFTADEYDTDEEEEEENFDDSLIITPNHSTPNTPILSHSFSPCASTPLGYNQMLENGPTSYIPKNETKQFKDGSPELSYEWCLEDKIWLLDEETRIGESVKETENDVKLDSPILAFMKSDKKDIDKTALTRKKSYKKNRTSGIAGKGLKKVYIARALSDLISCCKAYKFTGNFDFEKSFNDITSISEWKSTNLSNRSKQEYIDFTKSRLMRIYPSKIRVTSSNFDPVSHWTSGCQMVALNFQTW
ncbi:hypothetical protein HK096_000953, partial [Nowakowskiella sp. JEL0078]